MHVKSLSQGLNVDSNPGPPDPEAKCLPVDHNATLYFVSGQNGTFACDSLKKKIVIHNSSHIPYVYSCLRICFFAPQFVVARLFMIFSLSTAFLFVFSRCLASQKIAI